MSQVEKNDKIIDKKDKFISELKELLHKYNADIQAESHFIGYPTYGEDIRITASIHIPRTDKPDFRERIEIDLGTYIDSK